MMEMERILSQQRRQLTQYTHATILHATENWMKQDTKVEIRFAFEEQAGEAVAEH